MTVRTAEDLDSRRQRNAELIHEAVTADLDIEAVSGWDIDGDHWRRPVFLANPDGGDSILVGVHLLFPAGLARPIYAYAAETETRRMLFDHDAGAIAGMILEAGKKVIGKQIVDADGETIQGVGREPFGLTTFSVLTGEAIEAAEAWLAAYPDFCLDDVFEGDIEAPEIVDTLPPAPAP